MFYGFIRKDPSKCTQGQPSSMYIGKYFHKISYEFSICIPDKTLIIIWSESHCWSRQTLQKKMWHGFPQWFSWQSWLHSHKTIWSLGLFILTQETEWSNTVTRVFHWLSHCFCSLTKWARDNGEITLELLGCKPIGLTFPWTFFVCL